MFRLARLKRIFTACILCCSALTAEITVACTSAWASTEESRMALEELSRKVRFVRLENGLRVIMYKRGVAPVFAGAVSVRVGGTDEMVGNTGISHMFEHMAFKGTPLIGTRDYEKEKGLLEELEDIAARSDGGQAMNEEQKKRWAEIQEELNKLWINGELTRQYIKRGGTNMNATTGKELTNYFVNLPRPAFEFWCWIESERLMNTVMRQFYQERDVVMEERRMRSEDDPEGKLYELLLGVAYLKHPYRNPVIGYDFDIKRLTARMVTEFHKKYYVPSNMVVSVVGDIDTDKDLEIIRKYFGKIPAGPQPELPKIQEVEQDGQREVVLERPVSPQLYLAYRKPQYPHPDDARISLMLEILAGSSTSPMYEELVKKRQLASNIGYTEAPGLAFPNLILFYATAKNPHTNQDVLEAFESVLADFKREPVTQEKLDIARRAIAMDFLGSMKSNMSLALDFASAELIYNDWQAPMKWFEEIMRVTTEDVQRAARTYLVTRQRTVGRIERIK